MAGDYILFKIDSKLRGRIDEALFTAILAIDDVMDIMYSPEVQGKETVSDQKEVLSRLRQIGGRLQSLREDLDYFEELEEMG